MATVQFDQITKSYGAVEAIRDFNLDIEDGEFCVFVGPSGCGKSTALKMLAGLEATSGGTISIGGRDVTELGPGKRDIAMVFQNYALYPHMSVFDNMAYGLKIQKVAKPEIAERVQTAAKLLQLEPYLQRKPRELSGGQRQRVAMGRAIVRKPAVFLFDEPLSNLDAKLRVQMRLEIKALQRELGVTSLYVTHDQVEAMTLADRMIVMNAGVADQIGAPLDVYADPATEFVAGFIGSPPTNFIDAALLDGERAGRIGIRPEHVRLAEQGRIEAVVVYAEALGAETLVHLRAGDGQQITVRQESGLAIPTEGQSCGLAWDSAQVMRFDEAGLRQR